MLTYGQLMTAYETVVKLDVDPELKLQKATAKFACLCGKRELFGL